MTELEELRIDVKRFKEDNETLRSLLSKKQEKVEIGNYE